MQSAIYRISSYLWLNCPGTFCEHSLLQLNSADNCSLFWSTCVTPLSKKPRKDLDRTGTSLFWVMTTKQNKTKITHKVSGLNLCRWATTTKKASFWMLNSLQALPGHYENNHQHLLKASLFINSICSDFNDRSVRILLIHLCMLPQGTQYLTQQKWGQIQQHCP